MSSSTIPSGVPADKRKSDKFLSFSLNEMTYGVDVLKVREIIAHHPIRPVADFPPFIKGIINLRGKIIPVIDLRLYFKMPEAEATEFSAIILVNREHEGQKASIGLLVDYVNNVMNVDFANMERIKIPGMDEEQKSYIIGAVADNDTEIILLDVDSLLTKEEVEKIAEEL